MSNFTQMTNNELYNFFSDLHKDVFNVRPQGTWHRDTIIEFCERWTSPEAQAELQAQWREEDAEFEHMLMKSQLECDSQQTLKELDQPDRFELMAERFDY